MTELPRLLLHRCLRAVLRVAGMVPANGWTALLNLIAHLNLAPLVVEPARIALDHAGSQTLSMIGLA